MIYRWIAALLGGGLAVNALIQLALPLAWYDAVPGVPLTGPFNPHFVRDIGMAYLVVVLGWSGSPPGPGRVGRRWSAPPPSWACTLPSTSATPAAAAASGATCSATSRASSCPP